MGPLWAVHTRAQDWSGSSPETLASVLSNNIPPPKLLGSYFTPQAAGQNTIVLAIPKNVNLEETKGPALLPHSFPQSWEPTSRSNWASSPGLSPLGPGNRNSGVQQRHSWEKDIKRRWGWRLRLSFLFPGFLLTLTVSLCQLLRLPLGKWMLSSGFLPIYSL